MVHYQRNVRIVTYIFLPLVGFLLGWNLSLKNQHQQGHALEHNPIEVLEPIPVSVSPKAKTYRKTDPGSVDTDIFWETWGAVEANFLYKENLITQNQVHGAARGMIDALEDPYTTFFDPKETQEFEESINGEFQGIGAEIGIREDRLTVISPLKGSPAELAGLRSGDQIFQIDGESTLNISLEEAVRQIRGPKGEKVTLTVIREGERKPVDIVIVRDNIVIESLEWKREGDTVIITISSFSMHIEKDFLEAVSEIMLDPPESIVLDLRNNPGGILDGTVRIASEFMPGEVIVKTRGLKFGQTGDLVSRPEGAFVDTPMVVLVNGGSASASEIFAGAVQDHRRGVVIGSKTYGKGSVQQVIPLSDGSSLKVTMMEWLTPDERSIHDQGIEPHEIIEMDYDALEEGEDPQLERALAILGTEIYDEILAGPIPTPQDTEEQAKQQDESMIEGMKSEEDLKNEVPEGEEAVDPTVQ